MDGPVVDSTLRLTSSAVRESKEKILGIVRSSLTGYLYTVDRLAVRVWGGQKQVKALHFTETGNKVEVVGWEYLSGIDGVVGLLHVVKPNDGDPLVTSTCRVWGPTLQVLCHVNFDDTRFSHFCLDARQETFFVVESRSLRVRVLRLTTVRQQPDAPLFAKASARHPRDLAMDSLLDSGSDVTVRYKCDIKEDDGDAFVAPSGFATACFFRHNAIVLLSNVAIHLFSKAGALVTDGETSDIAADAPLGFTSRSVFPYADVWGDQAVARPSCAQMYDHDKLIVGFWDGRIRVLLCVDGLISERRPTVLFDFQCNSDRAYPVSCFYTAPWSASSGGDGLALDLVSLGGDRVLSHWRLHLHRKEYTATSGSQRAEILEKKKSQFLGFSHLLGEHVFGKATSSATSRTRVQKHCIVAFEDEFDVDPADMVSGDDPGLRKKRVATAYDGLLHYFDVHEPHRTVLQSPHGIIHAAVRVEQQFYTYATVHVGELRLLSVPLLPDEPDDSNPMGAGGRPFVRMASLYGAAGQPTVVYFAGGDLDAVFVGFSSGMVQCFSSGDNYLAAVDGIVDTSIVHTAAIRKLLTVVAPRPLSIDRTPPSNPGQGSGRLLVLLVGDDQGILSTWRVAEKNTANQGGRPAETLRWAAHAHLGAVIYTVASTVGDVSAASCNVVVTACNRGLVKCWVLQPTGKMALSAFFHSMPSLSSVVCLAVAAHSSPLETSSTTSAYRGGRGGKSKHVARTAAVSFLCLCADSFGKVESRLLSNDPIKASQRPVRSMHVTDAAVMKMSIVAANVNDDRVHVCGETSMVLCAAIDGNVAFLELDETGYFRRAGVYFSVPFTPINISQLCGLLHFVGPAGVIEVRKFDSSEDGGFGERPFLGDFSAFEHDGPALLGSVSETSGSVVDEESYPDNASFAQSAQSRQTASYAGTAGRARFPSGMITKRRQLMANISTAVPGVDVQSARKDGRLLDLFKHFDVDGKRFLSRADAITVVKLWLGMKVDRTEDGDINVPSGGADNTDHVVGLFADPLFDDDQVPYLELAAVAAAARTALQRAVQVSSKKLLNYATMRMSKRAITYNIMGEKQECSSRVLVDGVPEGQAGPVRAVLSRVTHKVQGREAVDLTSSSPILLSALPPGLARAVRRLELPPTWSPTNAYYLDLRRTVRIIRTVLDTRCAMTEAVDDGLISKQVIDYFQTSYGASLDVASDKILNFTEALLQYSSFPVVNSMRRLIFEEEETEGELFPNKKALSYYLRMRQYMYSKGFVIPGDYLPREGAFDLGSSDTGVAADVVSDLFAVPRRQLIDRLHALECLQWLFETAKFGPVAVQRMFSMAKMLPAYLGSVDNAFSVTQPTAADYIDCENFLDVLLVETGRLVSIIDDLKQAAFAGINYDLSLMTTPNVGNTPEGIFFRQIVQTNSLMHSFLRCDSLRTGRVDVRTFRDFVLRKSRPVAGSMELALKFVDECLSRFRCGNAGNEVSYLDLWATLLAYMVQRDDASGGHFTKSAGHDATNFGVWANAAVLGLKRGLDENRAAALVTLLGYVPYEETDETLVVAAPDTNRDGAAPPVELHVPKAGTWTLRTLSDHAAELLLDETGLSISAATIVHEDPAAAMTSAGALRHQVKDQIVAPMKRKATLQDILRPKSSKAVLGDVEPENHDESTKADLHPVILTVPLVALRKDDDVSTSNARLMQTLAYGKSYSRSVGSLDAKLVDMMQRQRDHEVDDDQPTEAVQPTSAMLAPNATDATTRWEQPDAPHGVSHETITCNEIEQLRIAQLVRQHDTLVRIQQEQDILRKRREKRQIDAQLLVKKDRRQPKKRKPLAVYSEPARPPEPIKRATPEVKRAETRTTAPPPPVAAVKPPAVSAPQPPALAPTVPLAVAPAPAPAASVAPAKKVASVTVTTSVVPEDALPAEHKHDVQAANDIQPAVLPSVDIDEAPIGSPLTVAADADGVEASSDKDVEDVSHFILQEDEVDGDYPPAEDLEAADVDDGDDAGASEAEAEDDSAGSLPASVESVTAAKRDSLEVAAAAMRVDAPLVTPAPVLAIVTPHVEQEEERNREQFEAQHMLSNDVDASTQVPPRSAPRVEKVHVAPAGKVEEDDDDDAYYSSSGESEVSDEEKLSYAEKRIRLLKKKLEEAKRGYHPRRVEEEMAGVAFFPMLFSDDLVYNPCESSSGPLVVANQGSDDNEKDRLLSDDDDDDDDDNNGADPSDRNGGQREYKSAADFADIRRIVQEHKAMMHRERLLQLYKTSAAVPEEWVSVMRKKGVDWDTFMDREKSTRLEQALTGTGKVRSKPKVVTSPRPITKITQLQSPGPLPGGHVAAALEQIAAMNASEGTTAAPATKASTTLHADVDAAEDDFYALRIENHERRLAELADSNDALPPPADPRPLPFGRVYSGICEIDVPQYYYVSRWFFFFKSFAWFKSQAPR